MLTSITIAVQSSHEQVSSCPERFSAKKIPHTDAFFGAWTCKTWVMHALPSVERRACASRLPSVIPRLLAGAGGLIRVQQPAFTRTAQSMLQIYCR